MVARQIIVDALCGLRDQNRVQDVVPVLRALGLASCAEARKLIATENPRPDTIEYRQATCAKMMLCYAEIGMTTDGLSPQPLQTPPQTARGQSATLQDL
jgi:hypothetical protein